MTGETETFDSTTPAGVFTSRWWGIVSTVYMLLGPFAVLLGWIGTIGPIFDGSGPPRALLDKPQVYFLVCLLAPLVLGFVVATAIEFRRKAEPPLSGWRLRRRILRIVLGFLFPFLPVWLLIEVLIHS